MAKKIQAWVEFGPRLELGQTVESDELLKRAVEHTNQTRGSIRAVLDEVDVLVEEALRSGQCVHLPNGTQYRPVGHADGSITIEVHLNPELVTRINTEYRGVWRNAENKGKSEEEIVAMYNKVHPNDPIV